MRRPVRRSSFPLAVLAALAVLLLAACGGGTDSAEEAGGTDDAGGDVPADGGDGAALLTDAECRQYAEAFQQVPAISDPDSMEGITDLADVLEDAAGRMPEDVADDFRVIADAYRDFGDALAELDVDVSDPQSMAALTADDMAQLEEASQTMGSAEVQEASENINAFLTENCT